MRDIKFEKLVPFLSVLFVAALMFLSGNHATNSGAKFLGYTTIATAFAVLIVSLVGSTIWHAIDDHHGFQADANGWFIRSKKNENGGIRTKYEALPIATFKTIVLLLYFTFLRYVISDPAVRWIFFPMMIVSVYYFFSFAWVQFKKIPHSEKFKPKDNK